MLRSYPEANLRFAQFTASFYLWLRRADAESDIVIIFLNLLLFLLAQLFPKLLNGVIEIT